MLIMNVEIDTMSYVLIYRSFIYIVIHFAGSDKICLEGASKPGEKSRTEFLLEDHRIIMQSKKYNFESCRIRVNNRLNMEFLRHMLSDYKDLQVCEFLEYGFPLGCSDDIKNLKPNSKVRNHKGARDFPLEIESYLESEIRQGKVLGLFSSIPFESDIFTRP